MTAQVETVRNLGLNETDAPSATVATPSEIDSTQLRYRQVMQDCSKELKLVFDPDTKIGTFTHSDSSSTCWQSLAIAPDGTITLESRSGTKLQVTLPQVNGDLQLLEDILSNFALDAEFELSFEDDNGNETVPDKVNLSSSMVASGLLRRTDATHKMIVGKSEDEPGLIQGDDWSYLLPHLGGVTFKDMQLSNISTGREVLPAGQSIILDGCRVTNFNNRYEGEISFSCKGVKSHLDSGTGGWGAVLKIAVESGTEIPSLAGDARRTKILLTGDGTLHLKKPPKDIKEAKEQLSAVAKVGRAKIALDEAETALRDLDKKTAWQIWQVFFPSEERRALSSTVSEARSNFQRARSEAGDLVNDIAPNSKGYLDMLRTLTRKLKQSLADAEKLKNDARNSLAENLKGLIYERGDKTRSLDSVSEELKKEEIVRLQSNNQMEQCAQALRKRGWSGMFVTTVDGATNHSEIERDDDKTIRLKHNGITLELKPIFRRNTAGEFEETGRCQIKAFPTDNREALIPVSVKGEERYTANIPLEAAVKIADLLRKSQDTDSAEEVIKGLKFVEPPKIMKVVAQKKKREEVP